ncbi:hypothetical protein HGM15179_017895 [Zosterops borbonicus]|uniref:Uncharacterized protein n=1 Tax=Zosterops borbonicus TaxID=364589 RepID=A0A8K1LCW9_9PASS|nr:hypothetical protein HGM15179_017895 [Zosterops borbonicus]
MGQDHICLSQGSAQDPVASCLVGIPLQESDLPPGLLKLKAEFNKAPFPASSRKYSIDRFLPYPITNPYILWRDWVSTPLPKAAEEPQELELLGSSRAPFCVQFVFTPTRDANLFTDIKQIKRVYHATPWCVMVAHVKMASTLGYKPLALPKGLFLICRDRAYAGIPSRLLGGPCTLGRLSLLTPNKTMIMDWIVKNSSAHAIQKET